MSVILTDQGFVEVGGELTHWDRGYIKQGHKWITRKMKNGKWVYTYKDAVKDVDKYKRQADRYSNIAQSYKKEHNKETDTYREQMAEYATTPKSRFIKRHNLKKDLQNTKKRAAIAQDRIDKEYYSKKHKAYAQSEDAKRMQASAQRVANKKRDAKPTSKVKQSVRNRKRRISNWLKERKAKRS